MRDKNEYLIWKKTIDTAFIGYPIWWGNAAWHVDGFVETHLQTSDKEQEASIMKTFKKLISAVLAAAMLLTMSVSALAAGAGFSDVADDAWYAEAVEYVYSSALMNGTGDTTFSPDMPTSRAMLATILYRDSGSPAVSGSAAFADVAETAYYADAVAWASETGVMYGYGNGLFGSDDPVSREQIATILWRYAGSPAAGEREDYADESAISAYAADAVDWARDTGVMSGTGGNYFDPQSNATRAQVAMILYNYLATGQSMDAGTDTDTDTDTDQEDTAESETATDSGVTSLAVSFENEDSGLNLAGILFLPDGFDETSQYAAVVVIGPMLSVKEQAQSIYAERLAENGFVALVFDYSYFGESEGEPRQLEEPDIKASDISSAVSWLQSLDYVDSENIGGLGICGSGSYMPYAAIQDERIKAVTSVVPATTMSSMIMMSTEQAEADREAYEAGEADPTYIDLMPRAYAEGAAYYYNEERGYRDNWDNHAVSWSELSWVDFHPEEFISELEAPYLIITGENAWSRSGAEQLYENTTSEKEFYVIEGAGHFDMYDLEPYVTQALDYIVPFFETYLSVNA